mgnify:CR=1 FL=1
MTQTLASTRQPAIPHGILNGMVVTVLSWRRRYRARATLARLDAHLLRDIGIGQQDVQAECSKPFWRD